MSGLDEYLKPCPPMPGGLKPGTVPPDVVAHIEGLCHQIFNAMEESGNTKQTAQTVMESLLASMQLVVFDHLEDFKLEEANSLNINLVLLTTLCRVALNNPLWDSQALTLQLKTECHQIVTGAGGIMLGGDD